MLNKTFRHFFYIFILLAHLSIGVSYAWKDVALGSGFTLAIDDNGALWAWGDNAWGALGIDDTRNIDNYPPQKIGNDTNWQKLEAGSSFALALKADGTLWSWGYNYNGQLGHGDNARQYKPKQIGTATDWHFITANQEQSLAIKQDGTLWGWGDNLFSQLGDGTLNDHASPVQIGQQKWAKIASGSKHILGIQQDGSLWAWGSNANGQVGKGGSDRSVQSEPIKISDDNWKDISAGEQHSLAIKSDGSLWSWGANSQFELGLNENQNIRFSPVQVVTKSDWQSVKAGSINSFAIDENGVLYSWGNSSNGLLGLGEDGIAHVPTPLESDLSWNTISTSSAPSSWTHHAAGIKSDNSIWLWGRNLKGELGFDESENNQFTPKKLPAFDSDNDGVADDLDAFPYDAAETQDSDNDGVGDNADAFPNDASKSKVVVENATKSGGGSVNTMFILLLLILLSIKLYRNDSISKE